MTATSIEIDTRIINNPAFGPPTRRDFERVNVSQSFYLLLSNGIRTLSTNAASIGSSPEGLLYTPRLPADSICVNASAPYVPENVTRIDDVPRPNFSLVALAPWLGSECTQLYMNAARRDLVRSFIFFLPGQGDMTPPNANDAAWLLNDGGRWKGDNPYPVYAVPTNVGAILMDQSQSYSGNMSTVPNGQALISQYDPEDYVKLYIDINLSVTAGLPSLWIFLVVILAVLVSIVGLISTAMHFLQRRRRRNLRRRVANGEVDLEIIGVKRLMVPREVLDTMPIYVYDKVDPTAAVASDDESKPPVSAPTPTSRKNRLRDAEKIENSSQSKLPSVPINHFDQPTCAICLDDFVPNESQVRQLPCGHIFHPECVDVFLMQTSSLCPLCKKSSLPAGYCPDVITNAMVRREKLLRRARERAARLGIEGGSDQIVNQRRLSTFHLRIRDRSDIEMRPRAPGPQAPTATAAGAPPVTPPPVQGEARNQWVRRRAEAMLGPDAAPVEPEAGQVAAPKWRKALRRVFPAM